jgi:hypothetical protein
MQAFHASKLLLAASEPGSGGMESFLDRQRLMQKSIALICGIGAAMTDKNTSILSSQYIFIGEKPSAPRMHH